MERWKDVNLRVIVGSFLVYFGAVLVHVYFVIVYCVVYCVAYCLEYGQKKVGI